VFLLEADLLADNQIIEVPVKGMDCAECTLHVRKAIAAVDGVRSVDVFLASEKAVIELDPQAVDLALIRKAVQEAGYSVPQVGDSDQPEAQTDNFTRPILTLLGVVFGVILFVIVVGEWLGLFGAITARVPWFIGLLVVLVGGYPVFRNVIRSALHGQIISHTLMTLGVIAALAVGEWATAAVVVFFMRVGDYVEQFTAERARRAVKDLGAMAPQTARVERQGVEAELPIGELLVGETVIVRPGENIPVDGKVIAGRATVNQATITGESMPVEAGPGTRVYAATLVQLGSLRVRTTQIGAETTFGKVIKLVEQAEMHRADVQRLADRFSAYYLPVVVGIAALTFLIRRDPLATAAVLVVACSCAFALATPIAMLASIGAGARKGLMIKGGKYLELLAQAEVLLIDKTGTLTLGKPEIIDVEVLQPVLSSGFERQEEVDPSLALLRLAASAERYSEHPLAEAVRVAARKRNLSLEEPEDFVAIPGEGVQAVIEGRRVEVGGRRIFDALVQAQPEWLRRINELESQGKTLLFVTQEGKLAGLLTAQDTMRIEVPQAIHDVRALGVNKIELLTGDNERSASALVQKLSQESGEEVITYRANLLPEDKIAIVKDYQSKGLKVIMVGDGVNDAPALAQADVGIGMGVAGSDVAIEAAHVALMRDDWLLIPEVISIARRTMGVVRLNIGFTLVYNLVGLSLAAIGILPPILAAAAQSLPDLGILANSSRLLRQDG
jgi:Cu+-exporting ATPase